MATVKPFRAWRYNPNKIKVLNDVIVPPYDVISPQDLARMKNASPYSFAHVTLNEGDDKHIKAAQLFKKWGEEKALVRDEKPAIYFYRQKFSLNKHELFCQNVQPGDLSRTGFFAVVKVEDYSQKVILPHEKTFSGPKADRYQLMKEAQGNMEPVFLGYDLPKFGGEDFDDVIRHGQKIYDYEDGSHVRHELWSVTDDASVALVVSVLKSERLYILDGHHRYETALQYFKDSRDPRSEYVLANICSFQQPGTVILPTHRVLKFKKGLETIDNIMGRLVDRQKADFEQVETRCRKPGFGVFGFLNSDGRYEILSAKHQPSDLDLDLDFLHEVLLKEMSSVSEFEISYVKDLLEVERMVRSREFDMAFIVRPNTSQEVMSVAGKFGKMPHKSTFFFPKIPSGLVIHSFE